MEPGAMLVAVSIALVGALIGWFMGRWNYAVTLIVWILLGLAAAWMWHWAFENRSLMSFLPAFAAMGICAFLLGSVPASLVAMYQHRKARLKSQREDSG